MSSEARAELRNRAAEVYAALLRCELINDVHYQVHVYIEEWGWLTPWSSPQHFLRTLALVTGAILARRRPLLVLLMVAMSIRHWRNCALAGVFLLGPVVHGMARRLPTRPLPSPTPAFLVGCAVLLSLARPSIEEPARPELGSRPWSDLELGGWLAYRGYSPFWDSRNDCYPHEVFADGVRIATRSEGWKQTLADRKIDSVITRDAILAEELSKDGWDRVVHPSLFVLHRENDYSE